MLSKKMLELVNKQINEELFSSYLYLSMSAYFLSENLDGFAHWMKLQAQEELNHAMKFFKYTDERGETVQLDKIAKPQAKWASPLAAFEDAYKHETKITASIYAIMNAAEEEKDYGTHQFLQWFIAEQIEEEDAADEVVQKLKMMGESKGGLFQLDHQLAKRGE